jgi:hypothetical protein
MTSYSQSGSRGVDPKHVQAIAGHSDVPLTLNGYSHAMAEGFLYALSVMDRVVTPGWRLHQCVSWFGGRHG